MDSLLAEFLQAAEEQSEHRGSKRMRICKQGESVDLEATIKQVADIVSILSGFGLVRSGERPTNIERRLQAEAYGRLGFLVEMIGPGVLPFSSVESMIQDLGLRTPPELASRVIATNFSDSNPHMEKVEQAHEVLDLIIDRKSTPSEEFGQPQQLNSSLHSQVLLLPGTTGLREGTLSIPRVTTKDENEDSQDSFLNMQVQEGHDTHLEGQRSPSSSVTATASGGHDSVMPLAKVKQADAMNERPTHDQLTMAIYNLIIHSRPSDCDLRAAYPRPFMTAPLPCGMCKGIVKDAEGVLTCDLCERVFHLRCLQSSLLKGIPQGDWYCSTCVSNTHGQHRVPKYGRVEEGFSFSRNSGVKAGMFPLTERSPAQSHSGASVSQRGDILATGVPQGLENSGRKLVVDQDNNDTSDAEKASSLRLATPVGRGNSKLSVSSGGSFTALLDSVTQAENNQHSNVAESGNSCIMTNAKMPASDLQVGQQPGVEPQSLQAEVGGVEKVGTMKEDPIRPGSSQSESSKTDTVGLIQPFKSLEEMATRPCELGECQRSNAHPFEIHWVGDVVQQHGGKSFYGACSVGGFTYKLQDCALFRPQSSNVSPYIARLQALWEDSATGQKWVRVNWCYYPADMQSIVGRPESSEIHEVYESNHGDDNLVEAIQGPCLVLRPQSYSKEIERRRETLKSGDSCDGLIPIFMCRFLYDVPAATFRLATEGPPT